MNEDWRYSDERMNLREQALNLLLKRFGSELQENGEPVYSKPFNASPGALGVIIKSVSSNTVSI